MADKKISRDEASRQMAAADKRIKGISSIASNTVKRAKILEVQKEYGSSAGNRQAVTSVDKALKSLAKSTEALAHGVKLITVETARGVKNITASGAKAMNEYAKAIGEDININRQNFMVTTIGKFTPLVGYAVAKMMETAVFRNMIEKMKEGLGRALNAVTSRFKKLAMAGWDKGKELWEGFRDRISGKRGAVKTKLANARSAKKDKKYFTQESAIKAALADAKVASTIRQKSKKKDIESQVPHMATGGFVKKEGLAKIHAAEVVQPIDKLVETIVKSVTETIEKRDSKKNPKEEEKFGTPGFFKKAKKRDLFGFAKISDTINRTFDIMTRKSLKLETRIMKRDKANQQGLIGSFIEAYTNEAKQEELPLMERQVRATLELKKTISGENKTFQAAISKMLYEHPAFHAMVLAGKGMTKLTTFPFKFLFRRRGKAMYVNDLSKRGTVFEQLANTSAQTYSNMMLKLDDIIANTYVAAQATAGTMAATKDAKQPKNTGARTAPQQKSTWSIAGGLYNLLVKKPAKGIGNFLKRVAPDSWKTKLLTTDISPKAVAKALWKVGKDRLLGNEEERAEKKAQKEKINAEIREGYKRDKEKKKEPRKIADENLKRQYAEEKKEKARRELDDWSLSSTERAIRKKGRKLLAEQSSNSRPKEKVPWTTSDSYSRKADREKKQKEENKKTSIFGRLTGDKDREGRKTPMAILSSIAEHTKNTVKEVRDRGKKGDSWFKKLLGWGATLLGIIMSIGSTLFNLPAKLGGMLVKFLAKGVLGKAAGGVADIAKGALGKTLGPIAAVAAAGAAGYAVGTIVNKALVTPIVNKMYDKVDDKIKEGDKKSSNIQKSGYDSAKAYKEGKAGYTQLDAQKGVLQAKQMRSIQSYNSNEDVKDSYGLFSLSGVNFQRVTNAQTEYMAKNVGEYLKYDPIQIDKLRDEWTKKGMFRSKNTFRGESWEEYGEKREEAFLKYLKTKGKPFESEAAQNAAYSKWTTTPQQASVNAQATPSPPVKTGLSTTNQDKLNEIQKLVTDFAPVINQFAGNTPTGGFIARWLQDQSNANPTAISNTANKIVSFGEQKWKEMGGTSEQFRLANIIAKDKTGFLEGLSSKAKEAKNKAMILKNNLMDTSVGDNDARHYGGSKQVSTMGQYQNKGKDLLNKGVKAGTALYDRTGNLVKEATGQMDADQLRELQRARNASGNKGDLATITDGLSKITTAVGDGISASSSFISEMAANPKEYAHKIKTMVWGNLDSIKTFSKNTLTKLEELYVIAKDEADYQAVTRGLKGAMYNSQDGGSLAYQESQLKKGISSKDVAKMEAKKILESAGFTEDAITNAMASMKDAVEKTSKQTTTMVNNVMNQTSRVISNVSNTNSGGGSSSPQRPIDGVTQKIMYGNIG